MYVTYSVIKIDLCLDGLHMALNRAGGVVHDFLKFLVGLVFHN